MQSNYFMGMGQFKTVDEEIPAIGAQDVLVKVAACGVCGTDVHIAQGEEGSAAVNPPVVLGHELAGIVAKVGMGVTAFKPGDHVTVDPNCYCGICHYCRIGKKQLCSRLYAIGVNRNGGFAQYCAVPQGQCYLLDVHVPLSFGAMAEPLACCLHGIDRVGIRQGDSVLVVGGGAIGLIMLQLAKLSGASKVIVSEPEEMRRKIATKLGADLTIDPANESMTTRLDEYLGVPGADVVIECVGNTQAVAQAFMATKRGSTVLLFSVPKPGTAHPLNLMDVFQKELTVIGSIINPDTHGRATAMINSGLIQLDDLITHRYGVSEVAQAIAMQMSAESIKVIVEP